MLSDFFVKWFVGRWKSVDFQIKCQNVLTFSLEKGYTGESKSSQKSLNLAELHRRAR